MPFVWVLLDLLTKKIKQMYEKYCFRFITSLKRQGSGSRSRSVSKSRIQICIKLKSRIRIRISIKVKSRIRIRIWIRIKRVWIRNTVSLTFYPQNGWYPSHVLKHIHCLVCWLFVTLSRQGKTFTQMNYAGHTAYLPTTMLPASISPRSKFSIYKVYSAYHLQHITVKSC